MAALEQGIEATRSLGNLMYGPLYEKMWREAAVQELELKRIAKEYLASIPVSISLPCYGEKLLKEAREGLNQYRSTLVKDYKILIFRASLRREALNKGFTT